MNTTWENTNFSRDFVNRFSLSGYIDSIEIIFKKQTTNVLKK